MVGMSSNSSKGHFKVPLKCLKILTARVNSHIHSQLSHASFTWKWCHADITIMLQLVFSAHLMITIIIIKWTYHEQQKSHNTQDAVIYLK
jgi:hypothetical protein